MSDRVKVHFHFPYYTVGHKNVPLLFLRYLWQMWTDFNNSFTFGFVDKLRNTVK